VKIAALVEALVVVVSALFIAAQQHLQSQELSAQTAINATSSPPNASSSCGPRRSSTGCCSRDSPITQSCRRSNRRYRRYVPMHMFVGEDFFLQHEEGPMSDEVWDNWRRGLARYRSELDKPQWAGWKKYFSPRYADFLDKLPPQPSAGF